MHLGQERRQHANLRRGDDDAGRRAQEGVELPEAAKGLPLDVLVTDMDWHHTCYRSTHGDPAERAMDLAGEWPCWTGWSFDLKHYPDGARFLRACDHRGLRNAFNLHFQSGVQPHDEAPLQAMKNTDTDSDKDSDTDSDTDID